jgi:hypothetical protein
MPYLVGRQRVQVGPLSRFAGEGVRDAPAGSGYASALAAATRFLVAL